MASDFFLYAIYNKTVGPGILAVTGDEASDVIVYSHCAPHSTYGANGTVDNFAFPPLHTHLATSCSVNSMALLGVLHRPYTYMGVGAAHQCVRLGVGSKLPHLC